MLYFTTGTCLILMVTTIVTMLVLRKKKRLTKQIVINGTLLSLMLAIGGVLGFPPSIYAGQWIGPENHAKMTKIINAENEVISHFKDSRRNSGVFSEKIFGFTEPYLELIGNDKDAGDILDRAVMDLRDNISKKSKFKNEVTLSDVAYFEYLNREVARKVAGSELDDQKIYNQIERDTHLNTGPINSDEVPGYWDQILKV